MSERDQIVAALEVMFVCVCVCVCVCERHPSIRVIRRAVFPVRLIMAVISLK